MAYVAPSVTADPAIPSETNTALAAVNAFVTTLYTDAIAAMSVVREFIRLSTGRQLLMADIDAQGAVLGSPGNTDPTVAASPVTQAQANTAYSSLTGYIDTFTGRFATIFGTMRSAMQLVGGHIQERTDIDAGTITLLTATAAITMASDPVTMAHMNTGLTTATAAVDTVNTRLLVLLRQLRTDFRVGLGNPINMGGLDGTIAVIAAH